MVDATTTEGYVTVTWADGTQSTYKLPDITSFSVVGNEIRFTAFPVDQTSGLHLATVLNFAQMRGYTKTF